MDLLLLIKKLFSPLPESVCLDYTGLIILSLAILSILILLSSGVYGFMDISGVYGLFATLDTRGL
jgi:hypothetical protein